MFNKNKELKPFDFEAKREADMQFLRAIIACFIVLMIGGGVFAAKYNSCGEGQVWARTYEGLSSRYVCVAR